MMFYMSVPPPFCFCSPKGTRMKIRSILTCIMLSLPLYLNCKTLKCVYCFLYSSFLYSFIVPFFVVANKYLLTYLLIVALYNDWNEISRELRMNFVLRAITLVNA